MTSGASWFPTPPPKPPKPIPVTKILVGTLVPLVAIAAIAVLVMTQKTSKSTAATGRSIAAFQACMKDRGAFDPPQSSNVRAQQQTAQACASHLPAGTRVPDFTDTNRPSRASQQAYAQCMQAALGTSQGGRVGAINRQAFENASSMCRALSSRGSKPPAAEPTTTSTLPSA
ncbi:MAG TPA: hypothetical protein VGM80_14655 [Gaiellaceae bacterium]|jgi:hypothetical protein